MEPICDLHIHSNCSDGTMTPTELVRLAQQRGLKAVALCDHNTVAGLPEFLGAAAGSDLWAVPGIEFSTDYENAELHILALFVKPQHYAVITGKMEQMLRDKEQSNRNLVAGLKNAGVPIDYDEICASRPKGNINRAVLAAEMVRLGYCENVRDAFKDWLSEKHGYYRPPKRPDALETIRFIQSIGAVSVLAHPFLSLEEEHLRVFLPQAAEAGLAAMEVYYPKFSAEQMALAKLLAEKHGLLLSGGSDFHGTNKPDIQMGTGRGNLHIPCDLLEKLADVIGEPVPWK